MSRRVYLSAQRLRVSRPGFDANTDELARLIFSSDLYGQGGSIKGSVAVPVSPENSSNVLQPTYHNLAIPSGAGIPVFFVWHQQISNNTENSNYPRWSAYIISSTVLRLQVTTDFALTFSYMCYRKIVS